MRKNLKEKIKESLSSVMPITIIVFLLSLAMPEMPPGTFLMFLFGAVMLVLGMGLFSLGADMAMMPMGESMGSTMASKGKMWLILPVCFLMGTFITVAEPDLQVLAEQVPGISNQLIIWTVAIGVGILLLLAILRMRFKIKLSLLLIICYGSLFVMSFFVPKEFLAVAFDSGGVTTGPITVPFLMAMGLGIATLWSRGAADEDNSFGTVALCSVGPIMAVMILGIIYPTSHEKYTPTEFIEVNSTSEAARMFAEGIPEYLMEVLKGILPIAVFFLVFQIFMIKMRKRQLIKIGIGVVYTFVGLVLFLTGANIGFLPVGNYIGRVIASQEHSFILIPLGMVMGYFIVSAEPAVHVLNKQVEEVTSGAIPRKAMALSLSIGVAVAVGIAMLRVLTGIPLMWFLVPGYAIALGLSFFVPKIFTAIAFDSGGVASGPMTATFLLPLAMGACEGHWMRVGGDLSLNILTDAFGVVAMVAMTPLITIQILGLVYKIKLKRTTEITTSEQAMLTDEVIDYTAEEDS